VLVVIATVVALSAAGASLVAAVAYVAMRGLGLEPYSVLLWLGLAEGPVDELAARRGAQPSFGNRTLGARLLYRAK
jgi:hypothetical protein